METRQATPAWRRRAPYLAALAGQLAFLGYVKDDAYIEFRYATNWAHGHGLVFNVGDPPVEGITSFAWTVALALPARLGLPLLIVAKLCGALAVLGVVALVGRWVARRGGDAAAVERARWLAASNATLVVFGQSGMEPAIAALLVLAGVDALERRGWGLAAAPGWFAVAALVRPEAHLLVALGAVVALARARHREARLPAVVGLAVAAALLGAAHAWRWSIYGHLVPNTALVKTASIAVGAGLWSLGEVALTSLAGVTVAWALVAAARRRDDVALLVAAALAAFALYVVRVGRDEMQLGRLYLPVVPLACGLAAESLASLAPSLRRLCVAAICVCGGGFAVGHLHQTRYAFIGGRSYAALAQTLVARGRPGDLVLFQDLGRTPYEALSLRFFDSIGLVDRPIAEIYQKDHTTPFVRRPSATAAEAIRDRVFARRPRFIALVAYVEKAERDAFAARFAAGEREPLVAPQLPYNGYNVGLLDDPRFAAYHFIDAWRRTDGYYLALYQAW